LDVVPKEVKERPLCPRDFLTHNVAKPIDADGGSQRLVLRDGEMVAESRKKVMEVGDAVEFAACDMKLERYLRESGQLPQDESDSYQRHRLRVLDLSRSRTWVSVLEYDYLVRWAVWRGHADWSDAFVHEYECAFTAKPGAAMIHAGRKYCHICHSAEHEAGDKGCIFRAPTGGANNDQGGKGAHNNRPRNNNGGGGGGNGGGGKGNNHANRGTVGPGDELRSGWFSKVNGKKVCIAWNKNNPGEPCASPCAKGFEHVCSYCKGPHRSATCAKLKLDRP
jgi:hypothetical protein